MSITGMPSRTGYRRRQRPQMRRSPSSLSGPWSAGQTRISSSCLSTGMHSMLVVHLQGRCCSDRVCARAVIRFELDQQHVRIRRNAHAELVFAVPCQGRRRSRSRLDRLRLRVETPNEDLGRRATLVDTTRHHTSLRRPRDGALGRHDRDTDLRPRTEHVARPHCDLDAAVWQLSGNDDDPRGRCSIDRHRSRCASDEREDRHDRGERDSQDQTSTPARRAAPMSAKNMPIPMKTMIGLRMPNSLLASAIRSVAPTYRTEPVAIASAGPATLLNRPVAITPPKVAIDRSPAAASVPRRPAPVAFMTDAIVNPSGSLCSMIAANTITPSAGLAMNADPIATPSMKACSARPRIAVLETCASMTLFACVSSPKCRCGANTCSKKWIRRYPPRM